jgi:hypothetical protein
VRCPGYVAPGRYREASVVAATLALLVLLGAFAARALATEGRQPGVVATARTYVSAIFHRDGATLCRLVDPATKAQLEQLVAQMRPDPSSTVPADCAHVAAFTIGYPHENMGVQFVGGQILAVGRVRTVRTGGHVYRGVQLRVRVLLKRTGYPTSYHGPLRPVFNDVVWLTSTQGRWRTAKPSLSLLVAWNGEILSDRFRVRAALQPPKQ